MSRLPFFSHSHHLLRVKGCHSMLDVLAFEGTESLSQPFCYRIEFTSDDHAISRERMLMKSASLTLQAPINQGIGITLQQPVKVIQGVIAGFERLGTSRDETHYALTLQPRLALLDRSHQNAVYQDMSVPQIVETILRERHHLRGQDFVFSLTQDYPRREQVMQYGEDDLQFITRLLGEVGIWFRFTTDTRLHIDVVAFYDSQQGYESALTLQSVPPSGQMDLGTEAVWNMQSRYRVVQKQVSTRDYNYRQAMQDMATQVDVSRGDTTTYGESYHYADNYLSPGNLSDRHPAPESGAFYARLRHERYLNEQTCLSGLASSATLSPGQVLKVTGGEEVTEIFARGVVIRAIKSSARRDKNFEITFDAIPDTGDYGFRPQPGSRPVMAGTLPARVTSTTENDIYAHIDKDGRYRVNMLFDRESWETGFESLWVRQARPYAGDTYGLHLPLLAGTEVAIGFEEGNPDRPFIAGVLHDSAHPDPVTIRNYRRNVLRTPSNNKIRLDDQRGQEHIKISTEYGGKSQLNLGHLVDGERQPRGEGFELRTDSWGALRAQKGIFISADGQAKAQGAALDMEAAILQLQNGLSVAETLSDSAEIAHAHRAENQSQKTLNDALISLKQSGLLLHAPEGIGVSSPKALRLSSGAESVGIVAGKNTDISVLKKFTVAAGEAVSLLAQKAGIKLFAAKGKVDVQAQSDALNVMAQKDIGITSTEGTVTITAVRELILNCGGAYIKLSAGGIEIGCPENVLLKCASAQKMGPADFDIPTPDLPKGFSEFFIVRHERSGEIMPFTRYRMTTAEGNVFEGVTDSEGKTATVYTALPKALKIELL